MQRLKVTINNNDWTHEACLAIPETMPVEALAARIAEAINRHCAPTLVWWGLVADIETNVDAALRGGYAVCVIREGTAVRMVVETEEPDDCVEPEPAEADLLV